MRVKEETFSKQFKVGLPNFSNITVGHTITIEAGEGEEIDRDKAWDVVNRQLQIQAGSIDATWMKTKEYSNFFKTTIRVDKEVKK